MIFITTGTCSPFDRLISNLDQIALELDEEIVAQVGKSTYIPNNMTFKRFYPSIEPLINRARLVISHGGFSCLEIIQKSKPLIVVPRQRQYGEHFDDHQVEFAELLHLKYKVPYITDIGQLTKDLLGQVNVDIKADKTSNLELFKSTVSSVLNDC